MHKYQAFQVAVLAGLIIAVTMLVFQSRALTFKLQALEAERNRPAAPSVRAASTATQPQGGSVAEDELKPTYVEKSSREARGMALVEAPTTMPKPAPGATPRIESSDLTPAQEQAVARSVDKILEEKYGHLPKVHKPEDMEKMLERELSLTASQKERITALFAKKREESSEIFKGQNPFSGKVLGKAMELDAKYESLVKAELDNTQQAKYDQLKKDGKINNGISIQIEAGGDDNE